MMDWRLYGRQCIKDAAGEKYAQIHDQYARVAYSQHFLLDASIKAELDAVDEDLWPVLVRACSVFHGTTEDDALRFVATWTYANPLTIPEKLQTMTVIHHIAMRMEKDDAWSRWIVRCSRMQEGLMA